MKKILSVMLAIMMLFTALSLSVSAIDAKDHLNADNSNVVIVFRFYDGKSRDELPVYDAANANFVDTAEVTGVYYLLPGANGNNLTKGSMVQLPYVTAAEGKNFNGWKCSLDGNTYSAGAWFTLDEEMIHKAHASTSKGIIYMDADYYATEGEGDTLAMVLDVLKKVFGTILGILFLDGSSSAGVELMDKLLGGLLG